MTSSCKFCCPYIKLRAGLDSGEEVHGSRILGKWSNMISHRMGSSLAGVNITAQDFQAWMKNDMDVNMARFSC